MKQRWQWTVVFAIGFRLFAQAFLLERSTYNACWMVPIAGFLLALPWVLVSARRWQQAGHTQLPVNLPGFGIRWLAIAYLLMDSAQLLLLFQEAGEFASINTYPAAALYLTMLFMALFVIWQNRNGVFGTGTAIRTVLLLFVGLLILFRIPDMQPSNLFPVLGGGAMPLLLSGLSEAGIAFQFLIFISIAPDMKPSPASLVGMWAFACASASVLILAQTLITAIMPAENAGLFQALGQLLASGRSSVSLQLPLYASWFVVLFILLCVNMKCIAGMLTECLRCAENAWIRIGVAIAVGASSIIAQLLLNGHLLDLLAVPGPLRYIATALLGIVMLLPEPGRKAVSA